MLLSVVTLFSYGVAGTAGSTMTTMLTTLALALIGGAQVVYGATGLRWLKSKYVPNYPSEKLPKFVGQF